MHTKNERPKISGTYDLHEDLLKIKEKFTETGDAIKQTAHDVKGKTKEILGDSFEDVQNKSADIQKQVGNYVLKNPIKAMGIAMLTGFVVSRFLFRK